MLPYAVVVAFVCASCSSSRSSGYGADEFFPEALVFEGLGLADVVNGSVENPGETVVMLAAGGLNDALATMNFHRENINDYLCRQYVVRGILREISKGTSSSPSESRSIASSDGRGTGNNALAMHADQGSSAYNAWLTKTKLLKRIYDEYDLNIKMYEKPVGFALSSTNNTNSLETRSRDRDDMKNSRDIAKNPERPKQHSHEDSFPSETISVDIAQSHSTQYDLGSDADGGHNKPPPSLPSHYGPPESRPTQSPQQQLPSSSYGPPSLHHPDTSYDELHSHLGTYGAPSPYSHSSYKPSSHSSHHESPDTPYGPPPYSSHRPSHSSHGPPHLSYDLPPPHSSYELPPPHSSYELPPHSYSYETPHLSYDHHFMPPTDYGPPSVESGPDHSTGEEEIPDGPDEETNNPDEETMRQGLTATDLYDLTLTAVAFLGFGSFVMNLIMDAMAIQSGATLMMNSSPLLGVGVSRDDKHAPDHPVISEIDELAWIAVSAMDNMMANVDGIPVDCDEVKQLCRRSELLVKNGVNFSSKLLPIWNVSLGWLSKKLGKDTGQPVISALLGHCALSSQCQ